MKRVLITGANSYVGTNVERWLMKEPDKYNVETLDMKDPNWINFDFSKFDVVFHVAGIVHKKEKNKSKDIYIDVNFKLALDVAAIAKKSAVEQFIFMSTMAVFGLTSGQINPDTKTNPRTFYAKSKFLAEKKLDEINDETFKVTIIRPPMVYGNKSPGNFHKLSTFIKKIRIISTYHNKRSMIYINHLAEYIKIIIDKKIQGTFYPQNLDTVSTMECCKTILMVNDIKPLKLNIINPFLWIASKVFFKKILGNLYYSPNMSNFEWGYNLYSFEETIERTEGTSNDKTY